MSGPFEDRQRRASQEARSSFAPDERPPEPTIEGELFDATGADDAPPFTPSQEAALRLMIAAAVVDLVAKVTFGALDAMRDAMADPDEKSH